MRFRAEWHRAVWGSWFPILGANTKARQGWGSQALILLPILIWLAACHSYHIDTTVENRTGGAIQLLEVDYPSASFGADSLAPGAILHYRIQLRGSGPLKVQYTGGDGKQQQIEGPALSERQEGQFEIVLQPGGRAEFHSHLTPRTE